MTKTIKKIKEYENMRNQLANINANRGGGPNKLKGFDAEIINTTVNNIERINKGQKAREIVINNNSAADSQILYANGQKGRAIQDKVGYTFSKHKEFITSGKYDGMIYRIDANNPIFSNEKHLTNLMEEAKVHNIKIVSSDLSAEEVLLLAKHQGIELNLRRCLGLDAKQPITATVYTAGFAVSNEVNNFVKQTSSKIQELDKNLSRACEDFSKINDAGLNVAYEAAIFTAALSTVSNLYEVAKGEKKLDEAAYSVLIDSVKSGCVGYVSGALMEATSISYGQASLIVNATINLSKQLYAFADGQINEEQLVSNIAMESVHLAGSYIGGVIGQTLIPIPIIGHMIGSVVGEIVTSLVCSEVVRMYELDKHNKKLIALYKNAEREIKESQSRLKELIDAENDELIKTIEVGFESLMDGIRNGSYDDIVKGIVTIGSKFGLTEQDLKKDLVTRNTLFAMSDDILVIE